MDPSLPGYAHLEAVRKPLRLRAKSIYLLSVTATEEELSTPGFHKFIDNGLLVAGEERKNNLSD